MKLFYKRPRETSTLFHCTAMGHGFVAFVGVVAKKFARASFWITSFSTSKSATELVKKGVGREYGFVTDVGLCWCNKARSGSCPIRNCDQTDMHESVAFQKLGQVLLSRFASN